LTDPQSTNHLFKIEYNYGIGTTMPLKILIVEDEISLQETLTYNLKRQGYEVEVVGDGLAALDRARQDHPDLILLDVMLPGMDGFDVCRTLRQEMDTPILFLTARDDEIDRVVGLELGADDYIVKPFSMRELLARVKTNLRGAHNGQDKPAAAATPSAAGAAAPSESPAPEMLTFGNLTVDFIRHEVRLDDAPLALKPKEFELLVFLVNQQGRAVSRDTILEKVWGWQYYGDSRTVDVHIRWLREKIEPDPATPRRIVTVRGAGYRFEG
jgi:DNA-binding response OmpR family regulator